MTKPARTEGFGHAPATIRLGDLEVQRLGYGAMRLPGKDVWGEPDDPDGARKVLRRAVDLGINFNSCTPADTRELARRIKGAEATIMPGLGRFPMSEDPGRFLGYLRPVLARILKREAKP